MRAFAAMAGLLMVGAIAAAAPVPKTPQPDPLGRAYLGVYPAAGTMRINSLDPGYPAEKAGILPGDSYVQIGDCRPKTFDEATAYIKNLRPGTRIRLTMKRGQTEITFLITLALRPHGT
ncbi:MAG: PDZ domain-containing protein [Gemmataceae bacterium]